MTDPATIVSLLQATLAGTTESIKSAEQGLEAAEKEVNFLIQLIMAIKEKSLPNNVRKAAALYTKKFTRNRLREKDQSIINATAEHLLNFLSEEGIDMPLKRFVAVSLEYLLANDHQNVVRETLEKYCIRLLETAKNGNEGNVNYEFLGFFVQSLVSSAGIQTKDINIFIQNSYITFCTLANRVFKYVKVGLEEQNKEKNIHMLRILKLYSFTNKAYLKKIVYSDIQTVKILYDDNVTELYNASFEFTFSNNELSTNIIYLNHQTDSTLLDLYHSIKADFIQSLRHYMRTVFIQFKDAKMVSASAVLNSPALIPSIINALFELLSKVPYHKIKSNSLIKLIEEILNLSIIAVRNSFYFSHFLEYKQAVLHGCILKVLAFSPLDYDTFKEEPDEFINQLLQIIEMDSSNYVSQKDRETMSLDDGGEIDDYSNLRTLGSIFLEAFAKHIDGSLSEILTFSIGVLKGEINQEFPKALLLLMISILRDQILQKENIHINIIKIICEILKAKQIPSNEATSEENIEYLMILLTVYRYFSKSENVEEKDADLIYEVVYHILNKKEVPQCLKISSQDLVMSLATREDKYQIPLIKVMNSIVTSDVLGRETSLETLANLYKYISESAIDNELTLQTIHNLANIVYEEVSKKVGCNQLVINKCWNIISDICENEMYIPKLIAEIEECLMPLLQFIDGVHNYDYEENILMMMSSFISKSQAVTQNELLMFEIIPKLFYSQYEFAFGHAFETLNIFILHGSQIIIAAPQALKAIIDMAVCCMNTIQVKDMYRNEGENCYGVILLQSLILSCGNYFTYDVWLEITKSLTNRLENPAVKGHILNSNIFATLALVVMLGYKCFSHEDNDMLLKKVLENHYCFVVKYSTKMAVIALSEILTFYQLPFVSNRFTLLLDTVISMLEINQKIGKLDKNPITDEEKDYDAAVLTVTNMVVNMDEIEHFKEKINLIKEHAQTLLQKTVEELPERKVQYLKQLLNISKVSNENRVIFKIKR